MDKYKIDIDIIYKNVLMYLSLENKKGLIIKLIFKNIHVVMISIENPIIIEKMQLKII